MHRTKKGPVVVRHESFQAAARWTRVELERIHLLKGAPLEAVERLLRDCPVRILAGGEVLVRAGDVCPALYLVLSGCLRTQDPAALVPDTTITAGDSVGELLLLQEAVVPWSVSAVEPTRVLAMDTKAAWALIEASHAVARNWLVLLAQRSRVATRGGASGELRTSYKRHATLDESTGLHNRHWLESILPRQIARSRMSQSPLGLLLLEIDEFADYTEQFGHAAADHARYAVAQTLTNSVRPTDLIASYSPAQFAVVLPEADFAGTCRVAERVRHAVSEAVVLMSDESILPSLTVSIGAAQYANSDGPAFLAAAEAALQKAKTIGGNRVGMQPSAD